MPRKLKKSSVASSMETGPSTFLVILAVVSLLTLVGMAAWYFISLTNKVQTDFTLSDNFYSQITDSSGAVVAQTTSDSQQFTAGSLKTCWKADNVYDDFAYSKFDSNASSDAALASDKWSTSVTRFSHVNVFNKNIVFTTLRKDASSWTQATATLKKVTTGSFQMSVDLQTFDSGKDLVLFQIQLFPILNDKNVTYIYDVFQYPQGNGVTRSVALVKWDRTYNKGTAFNLDGNESADRSKNAVVTGISTARLGIKYDDATGMLQTSYDSLNSAGSWQSKEFSKINVGKNMSFGVAMANVLTKGASLNVTHEVVINNIKYSGCFSN